MPTFHEKLAAALRNAPLDPRAMASGMGTAPSEGAAQLGANFLPGIGDAAGLVQDANMYATQPDQRKMANYLLTALSMAPGIPSASKIRKIPDTNYTRRLKGEVESLFREMSGSRFMQDLDLRHQSSSPFGLPEWNFAESADMALGQGANKGLMVKIDTGELQGKANFSKPALSESYQSGMGEFVVRAQPGDIKKHVREIYVSPDAYSGLKGWEKKRLDMSLSEYEKMGVPVKRVDKLPGR